MRLLVGDPVIITSGKDKGKKGVISRVYKTRNQVLVEGVNQKIRHVKKSDTHEGGRIEFFAPIDVSNVAFLADDKTNQGSRIQYKVQKDGEKVRIIQKTGNVAPSPKKEKAVPLKK